MLFTSIPLDETIDFILDEINVQKKLELFCKTLIFEKLLSKLCKCCVFLADSILIIKVNGCPMSAPISVAPSNIFYVKMEFDGVKPLLSKRYVDDISSNQINYQPDKLFEKLNNYHPNIKLTIEVNKKF